jgi:hypothetical protein
MGFRRLYTGTVSYFLTKRSVVGKVELVKNKCETCGSRLNQNQKRFCCHHCLCVGANKARVLKMEATKVERFWKRVNKTDTCWLWLGTIGNSGYGQLKFNGKVQLAHRVAWQLAHTDPGDLCVLHKCDNPPCIDQNICF